MKQNKIFKDTGFALRAKSWHLCNAFAEELKALGYIHQNLFNEWSYDVFKNRNCVWITDTWNSILSVPSYAFSTTYGEVFNLETEWDDALEYAKEYLDLCKSKPVLVLTDDYTAVVNHTTKMVEVGCQRIPFDKIIQLYDIINSFHK